MTSSRTELPDKDRPKWMPTSALGTYALQRALHSEKMARIVHERLTEPLHLNLLSAFVAIFGKFEHKIAFDLIVRQQFAFSILEAAKQAASVGIRKITVVEFGVAAGAGLLNMCAIASRVVRATGVQVDVFGFDTGRGMPPAIDYRDHPEHWQEGDFPIDLPRLKAALPPFAHLLIGDVEETIPDFLEKLSPDAPLGFVSLDVDYYSSAKKALEVFKTTSSKYLPVVLLYLDDIVTDTANPWCGENLAVREFNQETELRKISAFAFLRSKRIFKNARWIDQIYLVHILDHDTRSPKIRRGISVIPNEYIGVKRPHEPPPHPSTLPGSTKLNNELNSTLGAATVAENKE
jgi:hypothetical protein